MRRRSTPVVRGLLDLRLLIGRLFGWDSPRPSTQAAPRTTIAWLCDRIFIDAEQAKVCNMHGAQDL